MQNFYQTKSANLLFELFGAMLGDGCLSKYYASTEKRMIYETRITGNALKEKDYHLHLAKIFLVLFGFEPKPRVRKGTNTLDLITTRRFVFDWFVSHGFPCGKKTHLKIPEILLFSENEKLNFLLRGLFDTDGQISARKDEGYRYPYVFLSSSSSVLRFQVKEILIRQGISAYVSRDNVVLRGKNNFKRWVNLIGSSNPRNISRIKEFSETGYLNSVGARSRNSVFV